MERLRIRWSGRRVRRRAGLGREERHRVARHGKRGGCPWLEALLDRQLRHERVLAEAEVREVLSAEILDDLAPGLEGDTAVRRRPDVDVLGAEAGEQRIRA